MHYVITDKRKNLFFSIKKILEGNNNLLNISYLKK
jgi:hypothetical protein